MASREGPRRRGRRAGTAVGAAAAVVIAAALATASAGGTLAAAGNNAAVSRAATSTSSNPSVQTTTNGAGRATTTTTTTHPPAATPPTSASTSRTGRPTAGQGATAGTTTTAAPSKIVGSSGGTTAPATPGGGTHAAPTAGQPCAGTTPMALPGSWTCTFDDEFNGTALDTTKWVPQLTSNSGYLNGATACYVDNPDTVSVSGGTLNLSVRQVAPFSCAYPGGSFTASDEAGMVSTYGLFDQTYGAFEVSAKLPPATAAGLQETMWLYPQNLTYGAWPSSGEIDFAESYSEYPGLDVPYIHYPNSASDPNVTAYDCTVNQNTFNTYEVDWAPGTITVLYNGKTCLTDHPTTGSEPFDQPFFIALTQALGVGTNAFSSPTTPLPATTQIDWVRAWSPSS
jgi:beta-glucanase (GH16 family)